MLQVIIVDVVVDDVQDGIKVVVVVAFPDKIIHKQLCVQVAGTFSHSVQCAVDNHLALAVAEAYHFLGESKRQLVVVVRVEIDSNLLVKVMVNDSV